MRFYPAELHMAISFKNFDAVVQIVESGCKLDSLWQGESPVSCALYVKAYRILEYLVKQGANVNIRTLDNKMEPPLFAACRLGRLQAVHMLLQSPTLDIDQRDFFNRTPLWAAARYSSLETVQLLLDHGADVTAAQDFIECPLILSILMLQRDPQLKIPHLLIRRGCLVDFKNREGTPLYFSVKYENQELFRLLVRAGCSIKNEKWLTMAELPLSWKKNEIFCQWVCSLHNNPHSLMQLSSCVIRKRLVQNNKNIFPSHVAQLPLPTALHKFLLLEE
ncbi:ANK_REP_REGION domain-containing protein [Trichonephila clavata]|uniref:Alpha-latrotoxin n=1 Tax=Trichonephila clavata TaxID=2740835 RepID=A0A8X6JLW5_TRICU|nr:ANK_REP_REGION domain-containing protein [Trichonephila clavata]